MITTDQEIKQLRSRLTKIDAELKDLKNQKADIENQIKFKREQARKISDDIQRVLSRTKEVIISEHSIVRYIERVKGVDLKQLEMIILPESIREAIKTLGDGKYECTDSETGVLYEVVVKGNTAVTINTKD